MQKRIILGGGLTLLAALIMTGCEINDDVNPVPGSTTTVTVTPSLGKILNAKVVLKNAKTDATLGTGNTGNTGVATFTAQKTSDPVVVEVMGQAGAKYFDESKGEEVDFEAGKQIRAALPMLEDKIGVSTLTEVAYQLAVDKLESSVLDAGTIESVNEQVRQKLAPELTKITAVPHLVGIEGDLKMIANDEAGKYALKLAALAKLASSDATPALAIINQFVEDMKDGEFDGTAGEMTLGYTKDNLSSKITANLNDIIAAQQLSGFTVSDFSPVFGSIVITIGGGGTGVQTGNTCLLDVSGSVTQPVAVAFAYKYCYINMPVNACSSTNSQLNSLISGAVNQQGVGVTFNVNSFTPSSNCDGAFVSYDYATGQVIINTAK